MVQGRRRRSSRSPASRGQVTRETPLPVEAANDLLAGFKGRLHSVKVIEMVFLGYWVPCRAHPCAFSMWLPPAQWTPRNQQTQELKLEDGTSILIARVKVPTPRGISGCVLYSPNTRPSARLTRMRLLSGAHSPGISSAASILKPSAHQACSRSPSRLLLKMPSQSSYPLALSS